MLREGVVAGFDLFVSGLDFGGFEGRLADKLRVAAWGGKYMMTPTDHTSTS